MKKLLSLFTHGIKTRLKVFNQIETFEKMIIANKAEKERHMKQPELYAKYWMIEKDYQRNVELLKSML